MNQNQLFYGSIDLTLLIELAKKKHSAFTKGTNGHIYASINVWHNAEPDKFGNVMSVQVNPTKEMKDVDGRPYIGNLKKSDGPKPVSSRDVDGLDSDFDVPVRPPAGEYKNADAYSEANWDHNPPNAASGPDSDLPF